MRVAALVLLLSDAVLAAAVWLAAYEVQSVWGRWEDYPAGPAVVFGVFVVVVWIGLRFLLGLYSGYDLSPAERLRRHAYSVGGTLALLSFAVAFLHLGPIASAFGYFWFVGQLPRLLVALGFGGILLLPPLVQALVRWGMGRTRPRSVF